jgi:hypothetical protein
VTPALALELALSIECCEAGCGAAGDHVRLSVRDATGALRAEREVSLADVPVDARPRALALSAAELLRAAEQPAGPVPPVPPPLAQAGQPPAAEPGRSPTVLDVGGTLAIQGHPGRNMLLFGASPSVGATRGRWRATLNVEAMYGDPSVALGDVPTTLLAAALAVGPQLHAGRTRLALGLSGTAGWAHVEGNAASPTSGAIVTSATASALVLGAGGRLAIDVPFGPARAWSLRALFEVGAMVRGLDAGVNGAPAARLSGGYVLAGLGLGWTPGGG